MPKKVIILLLIVCGSGFSEVQAQNPALIHDRPTPFVSYLDLGIGITGAEASFSARIRKRLATDLFAKVFWKKMSSRSNLDSYFITGFKAKFYQNKSHNSLFAGPLAALHGFESGLSPLFGLTTGFDHYSYSYIFKRRTEFRLGFYIDGGMDTKGDGYIGGGISVGIGYYNSGEIRQDH